MMENFIMILKQMHNILLILAIYLVKSRMCTSTAEYILICKNRCKRIIVFGILCIINVSIVVAVPDCPPENRGYSYPTPVVSSYINGWTSNLGIKDSVIDLPPSSISSNTINTARVVQLPSVKYSETGVGGINEYENDGIKIYNTDTTGYNGVVPGQNRFYSSVRDQEPFGKIITRKILTANVNTDETSATTHVLQDRNKWPTYSFSKPPSLNTANTTPLAIYSTSAKFRSRDEVSHSLIPNTPDFSKSNEYKSAEEIPSLSSVIYKPVITTSKKINYDIQPGIFYAPAHTDTASPTLGLVYSKITTPKKGPYGYDGSHISQSYGGDPLSVYDYDSSHISHSSSGNALSNYKKNIALNKPTVSTSFISPIKSKTLHPVTYNLNTMLKESTAIPSSLVYLPPTTTYSPSYINPQPYSSKSRFINGQSTSSYQMNTYPSLTISTPPYADATKNLYYSNRISVPVAQAAYSIPSTVITSKLNIQPSYLTSAVSPFVTQKSIDSNSNVPALHNDYPVYANSLSYGFSAPASIATVNNPSYVNNAITVKTNEAPFSSLYNPNKITLMTPEVVSYTSGAQFSSLLSESNNYKIDEARRNADLSLLSAENKATTLSNSLLNRAQSHDYITRSGTLKKISKIPIINTSHAGLSGSNAGFTYRDDAETSFAGDSIRTLISNSPIHSTIISSTDSHPSKILLSSPSYTTYGTHRGSHLSQLSNLKLASPSSTVSDYNAKLLVNKVQHSTISKSIGTRYIEYYDDHPRYAFEYGVNDPNTGDIKHQKEERDGDVVRGEYSLLEPDGNIRTVSYYADWETGFHTNITNSKDSGIQGITQSNIDK